MNTSGTKKATFSVDDVLADAEQAVKEGKTRLLSQTLYQFLPDDDKLIIQDFDVIVLSGDCRHDIPGLTLKSIRRARNPKGSYFECEDVTGVRNAIQGKGKEGVGKKLNITAGSNGLMNVHLKTSKLHSGKIYAFRLDYDVPLGRENTSQLMFSGAIQPSDYHGICRALSLPPDAKKTMEVVVFSTRHFSAWFYDPAKNEYFPHVQESESMADQGYWARRFFDYEITGETQRARYFSMFVNLCPEESIYPHAGNWDTIGEDPLGIG
jgi:hypothetical protein